MLLPEALLIAVLILVNGFFAAMEMAMVTSRRARLKTLKASGHPRAQDVLTVKERPGTYLATVQVGISLVGTLASAVGGAAAVPVIAEAISAVPALGPYSEQLALVFVVLLITYASLVFGELVPKQLALRSPETLAIALITPIRWLSKVAAIPIKILSLSTDLVLRLIAPTRAKSPSTSSEEIESLLEQGTAEGIFQLSEQAFVSGVFDYGDRKAQDVMTARREMVALDASLSPREALDAGAKSNFSRFPIYEEDIDHIVGYVHIKDLIWAEESAILKDIARQIIFVPAKATLPAIYKRLTQERTHQAIVVDEHGGTGGMLTLEDVLEVIVGEIDDEYHLTESDIKQLGPNSWLVDGSIGMDELSQALGLPFEATGVYSTCAGLILAELGHIPSVGEKIHLDGYTFTVRKMDQLRVESVLIQREST
ncbi:MAG: hemolysin family protein [Chloroflexi bacterium]|nr:hemolysin family protein [Chloroflexota bacterium]